jgi:peptidoglycan hydrolase-like protein with peptidoglycan-binding domain
MREDKTMPAKQSYFSQLFLFSIGGLFSTIAGSFFTPAIGQMPPFISQNSGFPSSQINRPILKIGSQGEAVSELQATLKLLGFYTGNVDGQYTQLTAQAVSLFQQVAGLNSTGVVDAIVWERLFPTVPTGNPNLSAIPSSPNDAAIVYPPLNSTNSPISSSGLNQVNLPILKRGMRGDSVRYLQDRLRAKGFYRGSIDGVFGGETLNAVKVAQKTYRLTPDGVVGQATWNALLR